MAKLIALDDGHGINTGGKRTPTLPDGMKSELGRNYMNENLFNRAVVKYLDAHLRRSGFKTLLVAPTDADTPLADRTRLANTKNADLYVSVHANAFNGTWGDWGGTSTFTWGKGEGLRVGKIIHKHLMKGTPLRDRGMKDGSWLWVVRKTDMPAVLLECAFMDNLNEAKLLLSDAFRRECAREIAMGICEAYGVKYIEADNEAPKTNTITLPSVVIRPNHSNRTEVMALQKALMKLGYPLPQYGADGYNGEYGETIQALKKFQKDHGLTQDGIYGPKTRAAMQEALDNPKADDVWYRVRKSWTDAGSQLAAFHDLEAAKDLVDQHPGYKVYDENGKMLYQNTKAPEKEDQDEKEDYHNIMGESEATLEQMIYFVETQTKNAPRDIAKHFYEVGRIEGVRGDVALAQAIKETGWFEFGGDVTPDQNNFAGIGTTGGGVKGHSFETVREGVTAQIQHLKAYASKEDLSLEKVDPRFHLVTRGVAPTVEQLAGRWAVPGYNKDKYSSLKEAMENEDAYGHSIMKIVDKIKGTKVPGMETPKEPEVPKEEDKEEIDISLLNKVLKMLYDVLSKFLKK